MVLSVKRLTREGKFVDISFELRAGEIVGLAGLVGAGRTEIAEAIFGIDRYDAGSVELAGQPLKNGSPTAAMRAGMALVPEDRRQHGLVMDESIEHNVVLASLASDHAPRPDSQPASHVRPRPPGSSGCRSSTGACLTASRRSPAATSRRSCSPSG